MTFIYLLFSSTIIAVAVSDVINDAEPIPGTKLSTRTSYKVSLPDFPQGVLSYTLNQEKLDGYFYVEVDNSPSNIPQYNRGQPWFNESLWEFIPVSSCSGAKWYKLVNKGNIVVNHVLTWSDTELVEDPGQTNYIVIDSNQKGLRPEHDYLLKPVLAKYKDVEYYQLKLKGIPKGVVTYSSLNYGTSGSRYIMVDNSRDKVRMKKYTLGNIWYTSSLFGFNLPVLF